MTRHHEGMPAMDNTLFDILGVLQQMRDTLHVIAEKLDPPLVQHVDNSTHYHGQPDMDGVAESTGPDYNHVKVDAGFEPGTCEHSWVYHTDGDGAPVSRVCTHCNKLEESWIDLH